MNKSCFLLRCTNKELPYFICCKMWVLERSHLKRWMCKFPLYILFRKPIMAWTQWSPSAKLDPMTAFAKFSYDVDKLPQIEKDFSIREKLTGKLSKYLTVEEVNKTITTVTYSLSKYIAFFRNIPRIWISPSSISSNTGSIISAEPTWVGIFNLLSHFLFLSLATCLTKLEWNILQCRWL